MQFFGGVIFFACIAKFIPEPTLAPSTDVKRRKARILVFSQGFLSKMMSPYCIINESFAYLFITEKWRRGR